MNSNCSKRLIISLLSIFFLLNLSLNSNAETRTDLPKKGVGLVLSGGGAKGIAHVGVIKALEDNGIPIDYVTGTSMGAIVGSLYACGWSPEQMMALFTDEEFKYWSTGEINPKNINYFNSPELTSDILKVNFNPKDSSIFQTHFIPANLISPIPMNMEFLKLYTPYSMQCGENFDRLMVPFRCVTSDIYHKHKIVCSRGSLGKSVRASMSFPLVFKPIEMDGVLVYDGGIYDNFPVDVMKSDFNPEFIIGVSVSGPDKKPQQGNLYSQLEDMIIQNNDYYLDPADGVKIQVPVLSYGVLEFDKARTIYEIGYKTGLEMVDSIKSRLSLRRDISEVRLRRERFASETPDVRFDSVKVNSASDNESDYINYVFSNYSDNGKINMNQVEDAYYHLVNTKDFVDLYPESSYQNDSTINLILNATMKGKWHLGVGGWLTSSTNSFLSFNAGYNGMGFKALSAQLTGWIGQSYYAAELQGEFRIRSHIPSKLKITGVYSRQKYYTHEQLFFKQHIPMYVTESQAFANVEYSWEMGFKGKGFASLGYGYIWDDFYNKNIAAISNSDVSKFQNRAAALTFGYERFTLNNLLYPSAGSQIKASAYIGLEDAKTTYMESNSDATYVARPKGRIEALWKNYFQIGRNFSFGTYAAGMMTIMHGNRNYLAAMISNPEFAPMPSFKNYFNTAFRASNYLSAGVSPVWSPVSKLQIRGDFFGYFPVRNEIRKENGNLGYDGWFRKAEFMGEISAVYNFPFASLSVYCNYLSYPARNWNVGVSFGWLIQAPRFPH